MLHVPHALKTRLIQLKSHSIVQFESTFTSPLWPFIVDKTIDLILIKVEFYLLLEVLRDSFKLYKQLIRFFGLTDEFWYIWCIKNRLEGWLGIDCGYFESKCISDQNQNHLNLRYHCSIFKYNVLKCFSFHPLWYKPVFHFSHFNSNYDQF